MEINPQIFIAKTMHQRLFPKKNRFVYNVYYLCLPLSKLHSEHTKKNLSVNKFGLLSFYEKDHGNRQGSMMEWIKDILVQHSLQDFVAEIVLITMPRVLGYVFNPVSFWFCLDDKKNIRAVLCEVNNTFGETHCYLCSKKNGQVIQPDDSITATKLFHVSPFLKREGWYKFFFIHKKNKLRIGITFYNQAKKKQLVTSLVGYFEPLTKASLRKVFVSHPLITFKTIALIHWQALKLVFKGIRYIPKPQQMQNKLSKSATDELG